MHSDKNKDICDKNLSLIIMARIIDFCKENSLGPVVLVHEKLKKADFYFVVQGFSKPLHIFCCHVMMKKKLQCPYEDLSVLNP